MDSLQIIQLMISPVFMVSGCAILLSTSSNKSAAVIDRIRDLSLTKEDLKRNSSQLDLLFKRLTKIKNAVFCFEIAIGLFLLSSFLIGGARYFGHFFNPLVVIFFLLGMTSVLVGVIFLGQESQKAFEITKELLAKELKK